MSRAARLLLGIALASAVGCSWIPLRVVSLTPEERGRIAASRLQTAWGRGDSRGVQDALGDVFALGLPVSDSSVEQAWRRLLDEARRVPATRPALETLLDSWANTGLEAKAVAAFARSRLAADPERADEYFQRAWSTWPSPASPLLDPGLQSFRNAGDWFAYLDRLERLTPRTPAADARTLFTMLELSRFREVEIRLEVVDLEPTDRQIIEASLAFARGDEGGVRAALAGTEPVRLEDAVLRAQLVQLGGTLADLPTAIHRVENFEPALAEVLRAVREVGMGRPAEGFARLEPVLPQLFRPRVAVAAALLGFAPERTGAVERVRDAVRWAVSPEDYRRLEQALARAGDVAGLVSCLDASGSEDPRRPLLENGLEADLLAGAWNRLGDLGLAPLRALFTDEPELARSLVPVLLGHPDPRVRALTVRAHRDALGSSPALSPDDIPDTLSSDADPRVRAQWLVTATIQSGPRRLQAIARGLDDPDPYVRSVASELSSGRAPK